MNTYEYIWYLTWLFDYRMIKLFDVQKIIIGQPADLSYYKDPQSSFRAHADHALGTKRSRHDTTWASNGRSTSLWDNPSWLMGEIPGRYFLIREEIARGVFTRENYN